MKIFHLDYNTDPNERLCEINNLLARAKLEYDRCPAEFVILGDFNSTPDESPITACNEYKPIHLTDVTAHITHTFHDYQPDAPENKIDYIFSTDKLTSAVKEVKVWDRCSSGVYLSDHYPVSAEFEI